MCLNIVKNKTMLNISSFYSRCYFLNSFTLHRRHFKALPHRDLPRAVGTSPVIRLSDKKKAGHSFSIVGVVEGLVQEVQTILLKPPKATSTALYVVYGA